MNCREWEERIAGELDDAEVVGHLRDCPGCQVFASGLRETLAMLQAAHAEAIPAAHYTAVRARVMAELGSHRRWGWIWAVAAALAVVAVGLVGIRKEMRVEELPLRVAVSVPPPAAWQPTKSEPLRYVRRARPKRTAPPEEVLVKVETGDPDVVIYWITETKGDLLR
jgi:hypothetical protein